MAWEGLRLEKLEYIGAPANNPFLSDRPGFDQTSRSLKCLHARPAGDLVATKGTAQVTTGAGGREQFNIGYR
jgi:hypothetical protein